MFFLFVFGKVFVGRFNKVFLGVYKYVNGRLGLGLVEEYFRVGREVL